MSDPKKMYSLSETKIDESSKEIELILTEVNNLTEKRKYYKTF